MVRTVCRSSNSCGKSAVDDNSVRLRKLHNSCTMSPAKSMSSVRTHTCQTNCRIKWKIYEETTSAHIQSIYGCVEPDENVGHQFSKSHTELNWPQNSRTENSVSAVRFSKTDFGILGTVFTLSHSQFIFQHGRINIDSHESGTPHAGSSD